MNTADLSTNEKDLNIIYGSAKYKREPRELALASVKYLYTDLTDIRKYYIRLGFHLEEFQRSGYYLDFGYSTLYGFCEKNLGLDKSAVSRCINVYKEFNASGMTYVRDGVTFTGSAMELQEEYKDYSYTQLCEMLPLSSEQRKDITPDMTISQIREYKKELKNGKKEKEDLFKSLDGIICKLKDSVASTQQEDRLMGNITKEQVLEAYNLLREYCTGTKDCMDCLLVVTSDSIHPDCCLMHLAESPAHWPDLDLG